MEINVFFTKLKTLNDVIFSKLLPGAERDQKKCIGFFFNVYLPPLHTNLTRMYHFYYDLLAFKRNVIR